MAARSNASKMSSRLDMTISPSTILTVQAVNPIGRFSHQSDIWLRFMAYEKTEKAPVIVFGIFYGCKGVRRCLRTPYP
jgi:hypothetical protein